ncbi:MAG TPA: outer membrane beta-barrel protein [Gemmatimonadaceae bacterium]|nr:outer membrane beta-barrel protein [Gemmatimonadaceae bacterium]
MKRTTAGALTLVVAFLASTSVVKAQTAMSSGAQPITYGGGVGISMPLGDFGDAFGTGFHIQGLVGWQPANMKNISFRGELMFHHFGADGFDGHDNIIAVVPNIIYSFPTQTSKLKPYLIGGIGLYHSSVSETVTVGGLGSFSGSSSDTNFGINVGAGIKYPLSSSRASLYAELRFHDIFTSGSSSSMIPLTVGVMF